MNGLELVVVGLFAVVFMLSLAVRMMSDEVDVLKGKIKKLERKREISGEE